MTLQPGYNKVIFQLQNRLTGLQEIQGSIYLWDHRQKIVISDIDGTITKSDVLGQLYPLVNQSYCHNYITSLLTSIYNNNYRIIYLTARALVQCTQTRDFIDSVY
jgi:phosphatidate phosphatase LPIN